MSGEPLEDDGAPPPAGGQLTGTVQKWFGDKGFGFIIRDDNQEQIFAHHSDLGGGSLIVGGSVSFDEGCTEKGKPKAVNISGAIGPNISAGKGGATPPPTAGTPYGGVPAGAPPPTQPLPGGRGSGGKKGKGRTVRVDGPPVPVASGGGGGALSGTVEKWFADKGFGFIIRDDNGEQIFAHHSAIGGASLVIGGQVTFDEGVTKDGKPTATNISGALGPKLGKGGVPVKLAGTVEKWFAQKGFGFIIRDDNGQQIFAHHSDLGGGSLIIGGRVSFDEGVTDTGKPKAINIDGDRGPNLKGGKELRMGPSGVVGGGGGGMLMISAKATPAGPLAAQVEHYVIVPHQHRPGQLLQIQVAGQSWDIQVPHTVGPGQKFQVDIGG